jgi:hypothetical protein
MENGVRDRRRDTNHRNFADALYAERVHMRIVFIHKDHIHERRCVGMDGEAAVFALSKLMSRSEAEKLAKSSVEEASASGEHLIDVISSKSKVKADWSAVRNAKNEIACAAALVDRVLARFPR